MEQQYNFEIVAQDANVIVNDSMTSYTLLIERENKLENEFENLIIIVPSNTTSQPYAFIYKYTSSNSFAQNPYNPTTFVGEKTLTPINLDLTQVVNSLSESPDMCYTLNEWYCYGPGHHSESTNCTMGYNVSTTICRSGNGGGGDPIGNTTGDGSASGGGSSGSTNPDALGEPIDNPPIHTSPVILTEYIAPPDPCNSLKKKFADPLKVVVKNKANALNTPIVLNKKHESGFGVTLDTNLSTSPEIYPNFVPDGLNAVNIAGVNAYFSVHAHNNDYIDPETGLEKHTVKIPSPDDFMRLINDHVRNATTLGVPLSEVGAVVVTSQGTYALMLDSFDIGSFSASFGPNANPIKMSEFRDEYNKKVKNIENEGDLDASKLEKMLLGLMKDKNIFGKIGLFKATNTDNTSWARLTLNGTGNVIPQPCN